MINTIENRFITKPNLKKRIFVTIIDYILFGSIVIGYIVVGIHFKSVFFVITFPMLTWAFYFSFIEGVFGSTFGHYLMKLKVLTIDRRNVNISIFRNMLDPIDIFTIFLGIYEIRKTSLNQRLGDQWAKTIVVDKNDPDQY